MTRDAILEALHNCQERLSQLKAGQRLSENAETAFSRLAESVDTVLQERRVNPDRRAVVRANSDRRRSRPVE